MDQQWSSRILAMPLLLLLLLLLHPSEARTPKRMRDIVSRASFPKGFVFGAASAAFQYEGAVAEDGRKPSLWDVFAHTPGKIRDGSTADVALDQYHRYKEDTALMSKLGLDAYRLSISWPRMFPDGTGKLNPKAVDHYNSVIDTLIGKGIKPYVTLGHWDFPQALVDAYGGVLGRQFVHDFARYADACFEAFGDRVKNWITFNEPHIVCVFGYNTGLFAPGRCSADVNNCTSGNSATEPYIAGHHLLLAHAEAVSVYNKRYKASQAGMIGITLDSLWYEPYSSSAKDKAATNRAQQFNLGWILDPVAFGDYPAVMRERVGDRLPKFTKEESAKLRGSFDYLGINHYTSIYVADASSPTVGTDLLQQPGSFYHPAYYKDTGIKFLDTKGGKLLGQNINGFYVYPRGIRRLLNYIKDRYHSPTIYITENGISDITNDTVPLKQALNDVTRITYLSTYLNNLAASIRDGCNVKAYFTWSLFDTWEWNSGFSQRFGLYHIDYKNNLNRIPKKSAAWYHKFLLH